MKKEVMSPKNPHPLIVINHLTEHSVSVAFRPFEYDIDPEGFVELATDIHLQSGGQFILKLDDLAFGLVQIVSNNAINHDSSGIDEVAERVANELRQHYISAT